MGNGRSQLTQHDERFRKVFILRTSRAMAFFMLVSIWGCSRESGSPTNADTAAVTVEGTVSYFVGGGTREMPYPPGFTLLYAQWIVSPPDSMSGRLYLVGKVDSSFIGKQVRATGEVQRITLIGTPDSYKYCILNLDVHSIQTLGQ